MRFRVEATAGWRVWLKQDDRVVLLARFSDDQTAEVFRTGEFVAPTPPYETRPVPCTPPETVVSGSSFDLMAGGLVTMKPLPGPDDPAVAVLRRRMRSGAPADPMLLFRIGADTDDLFVLLDGHRRLVAARAEGLAPEAVCLPGSPIGRLPGGVDAWKAALSAAGGASRSGTGT